MAATKYIFSIVNDFPNQKVSLDSLSYEIRESEITVALDYINANEVECDIWFKDELSSVDTTSTLPAVIAAHQGEPLPTTEPPHMPDGRPVVRADSRPLGTSTYFTMVGDDSTSIGGGVEMVWDFSNDNNLYTGPDVPSGYKAKEFLLSFHCPIYIKDGTLYFFDAPWGQYATMDVAVPPGNYYPNPAGSIPAAALGLSGSQMYSYSGEDIISYKVYLNKHRMYGNCPMGDELNAEGAAVNAIPPGWYLRGRIYTPSDDVVSKGFASIESYRRCTVLLPGMTIDKLSEYTWEEEE
jgi:hypothetical protein